MDISNNAKIQFKYGFEKKRFKSFCLKMRWSNVVLRLPRPQAFSLLLLERGTRGVSGLCSQALRGDALLVTSFPLFNDENVTACQRMATISEAWTEGKKIALSLSPYSLSPRKSTQCHLTTRNKKRNTINSPNIYPMSHCWKLENREKVK